MARLLHFQFNNARYACLTQSNYVDFLTNRYTRTLSSIIYCFKWLLFDRSVFALPFSSPSTPFLCSRITACAIIGTWRSTSTASCRALAWWKRTLRKSLMNDFHTWLRDNSFAKSVQKTFIIIVRIVPLSPVVARKIKQSHTDFRKTAIFFTEGINILLTQPPHSSVDCSCFHWKY